MPRYARRLCPEVRGLSPPSHGRSRFGRTYSFSHTVRGSPGDATVTQRGTAQVVHHLIKLGRGPMPGHDAGFASIVIFPGDLRRSWLAAKVSGKLFQPQGQIANHWWLAGTDAAGNSSTVSITLFICVLECCWNMSLERACSCGKEASDSSAVAAA